MKRYNYIYHFWWIFPVLQGIMWLYPLRCMFISDTIPTAHLLIILLNILLIGIQATNVITAYRKESTRLEIIMLAFVLSTCITWITYLLGYIDFIVGTVAK